MPHKLKDPYRHKFNKAQFKLSNWSSYNESLKQRGNLTIWFTRDAMDQWYYKTPKKKSPGRQKTYSDFAIRTSRVLGTVFDQRLRQTEGLLESIVKLMRVSLDIPDYTTVCRRTTCLQIPDLSSMLNSSEIVNLIIDSTGLKIYGPGEWHQCKHRLKEKRSWRKLHLGIDRNTGKILCSELTTHDIGDPTPVPELLNAVNHKLESVSGDGAYDSSEIYNSIDSRGATAIIRPQSNAVLSENYRDNLTRRDELTLDRFIQGEQKWQHSSGYNWRSLVETAMYRYKNIIGEGLYCRIFKNQQIESKIGCYILNVMNSLGMPETFATRKAN
jgi:IS5 family transposase